MTVKIEIDGQLPKDAIVLEAFPSRGYVSTIAVNHMIKKLGMRQVGYMESDKLDSIAVVHDKKPMHPIRIYVKDDLVVLFSELMIPFSLVHEFTSAIGDWFKELKPKTALLLASVPGTSTDKEHEIMVLSTDDEVRGKLLKMGLKEMEEGVLTGMSSSLMIKCCGHDIPATSLMVETSYIPDVLAASSLLKILNKLLGLDVDVEELNKAGHEIEKKFKDTMSQLTKGQENIQQMSQVQSMYR